MHTVFLTSTVRHYRWSGLMLASLLLLLACKEDTHATATSASNDKAASQSVEAATSTTSSPVVRPSKRQLSPNQVAMAQTVVDAMKTKDYGEFESHIDPSFAAELQENPQLMAEMASFVPQEDSIKPPKLFALEDVYYEGYGHMLMATFDYPYAQQNMLFLIAFDAAEGSTDIKSLAVNTFPGSGDYINADEASPDASETTAAASDSEPKE